MVSGRSCCVEGCSNNHERSHERRYVFRFPTDSLECKRWLKSIPNPVELKMDSVGVCSRHWPRGAKFVFVRKNRRPVDPPSVFPNYNDQLPMSSKSARKLNVSSKTSSPKKLEIRRKKSPISASQDNKKGPYTLRKGEKKHYDLMMKGIDSLIDDDTFSPDKSEARNSAIPSTSTSSQQMCDDDFNDAETIAAISSPDRMSTGVAGSFIDCSDYASEADSSPVKGSTSKRSPVRSPMRSRKKGSNNFVLPGMFSPTKAEFIISPPSSDDEPQSKPINERVSVNRVLTKALSCHHCHSMFAFDQDLQEHRRSNKCMSLTERRFTCHDCQIEFPRRTELEKHVGSHTSWGVAHICLICKQKIPWKNLYDHLAKHRTPIEVS